MKVNIDLNYLEISRQKVVTGILSIHQFDGIFFPEERWNDYVVVILEAWMSNLNNLQQQELEHEDFYFMDGPYYFRITQNKPYHIAKFLRIGK